MKKTLLFVVVIFALALAACAPAAAPTAAPAAAAPAAAAPAAAARAGRSDWAALGGSSRRAPRSTSRTARDSDPRLPAASCVARRAFAHRG